ncbi:MAG: hypothetical protein WAJ85_02385 [Candidatus Baltobacteraceae bacterium]
MSASPQLGVLVVLGGVVLALLFMLAGVARLVGAAKRLSARLDEFGTLPILGLVEETQRKIDAAQDAVGTVPTLLERARAALLEIERSRERLRDGAEAINVAARFVGSLFAKI